MKEHVTDSYPLSQICILQKMGILLGYRDYQIINGLAIVGVATNVVFIIVIIVQKPIGPYPYTSNGYLGIGSYTHECYDLSSPKRNMTTPSTPKVPPEHLKTLY